MKKAEEAKAKRRKPPTVDNGMGEAVAPVRVEVPTMDGADLEAFFSTKEISEITEKVDMEIDDFDNIFIEANDM